MNYHARSYHLTPFSAVTVMYTITKAQVWRHNDAATKVAPVRLIFDIRREISCCFFLTKNLYVGLLVCFIAVVSNVFTLRTWISNML